MKIIDLRHRWMHFSLIGALLLTMLIPTTAIAAVSSACGTTYTVQSGDTLSGIAGFCGVSLSTLEQANPQITNYSLIYPGQQINIPQGVIPITGSQATIAISPVNGAAGRQLTVTGSNFPASVTLTVTAAQQGGSASATISSKTNSSGNFSTSLAIPSNAAAGSLWTITATTSTSGGPSASINFQGGKI